MPADTPRLINATANTQNEGAKAMATKDTVQPPAAINSMVREPCWSAKRPAGTAANPNANCIRLATPTTASSETWNSCCKLVSKGGSKRIAACTNPCVMALVQAIFRARLFNA